MFWKIVEGYIKWYERVALAIYKNFKSWTRQFWEEFTGKKRVYRKPEFVSGECEHIERVWKDYNMETLWRWLAKMTHPDNGGDPEVFQRVMEAKKSKDYWTLMTIASTFDVRFVNVREV